MRMTRITKERMTAFWKSEAFKIAVLVILAAVIRIYKLSKEVFWLDEANYVPAIFFNNIDLFFKKMIEWTHPPFFFMLYHIWGNLFGISKIALISFSILSGVISIVIMYILVDKLIKNRQVAFVSALLACFSLFHFHYSRDATEYMFFPMLIFLSLLTFVTFVASKAQNRLRDSVFYLIATTIMFYTHNYAFMIILVENVAFFMFAKKNRAIIKWWVIIQVMLLLCILPELNYTYQNAQWYGEGLNNYLSLGEYGKTFQSEGEEILAYNYGEVQTALDYHLSEGPFSSFLSRAYFLLISVLMVFGVISAFVRLKKTKKGKKCLEINKERLFAATLLLLLFFIPILMTSVFPQTFRIKCFVFTVLVYSTFLGVGIMSIPDNRFTRGLKIALIAMIIGISSMNINHSIDKNYFFAVQEDWRGAAEFLKQPENRADLIVVHVHYTLAPFLYEYNSSLFIEHAKGEFYPLNINESEIITIDPHFIRTVTGKRYAPDLERVNQSLKRVDDFWLVSSPHADFVFPGREVFNLIEQNFNQVSEQRFGAVYTIRYRRK